MTTILSILTTDPWRSPSGTAWRVGVAAVALLAMISVSHAEMPHNRPCDIAQDHPGNLNPDGGNPIVIASHSPARPDRVLFFLRFSFSGILFTFFGARARIKAHDLFTRAAPLIIATP